MQKTIYYIMLFMLCCANMHASKIAYSSNDDRFQLENPQIILDLSTTTSHIPFIRRGEWKQEKQPIFSANFAIQNSLPKHFLPLQVESAWETARTKVFHTAQFTGLTANGVKLLWKFDLHRERPIIRQQTNIHNPTQKAIQVPWYPIFQGIWATPSNKAWIRWWDSLHYTRHQEFLSSTPIKLGSYMQSSDVRYSASNKEQPGTLPYWMIGHPRGRILFGLAWTGGWKTTIKGEENSAQIFTHLPAEETQLTLQPGETINGPILHIYCTRETDDNQARKAFMRQRQALAQELYGGPQPSLPLVWNHWYSCRFDFDREYFLKQADAMTPYGFDYFVVDAGWYKGMGEWIPDPQKFKPGELESGLREISDNGIPVGIWSCPQYVSDPDHPHVDDPPFYRKFIGGYLLDMAGMDFSTYLKNHVRSLREQFYIDWWKYDQDFFVAETRHGIMKNVIALQ
ncbi:hypothetical protein GF373_13130, partial [bacterium]|nr:hypothetical protein [bacterium]